MNVGIFIYDDAEVMDFAGPFEVFSVASRFLPDGEKFKVSLVAERQHITARGGFRVEAGHTLESSPDYDLLIVVGGVHTAEMRKPHVLEWIAAQSGRAQLTASVCTGAFLLAAAGVLTDQRVTTHWEDIPELRSSFPALDVVEGVRWVDDNIVTSAGITAGIDMSLYLVSKLKGRDLAERVARQMDFAWTENGANA